MAGQQRKTQGLAQVFHLLGDPTRLAVLSALNEGEVNVSELCKRLHLGQPTVSRHLSLLKMSSLAEARRVGKEVFYSISVPRRKALKAVLQRAEGLLR